MVEALESYAEATTAENATAVIAALVAHHKQMHAQLSAQAPPMNATKWGFGRYSDAIVGIQWLLVRRTDATTAPIEERMCVGV